MSFTSNYSKAGMKLNYGLETGRPLFYEISEAKFSKSSIKSG